MIAGRSTSPPDSVSGLIERITFFNEETGFAVLKVRLRGQREEATVVGSVASPNPGEWLTAEGSWVRDRQFGLQFRASTLSTTAPTTREGIEKYLGSGLVKGIGPIYAKKLVHKFGEKIFDIIENYSARLEEVEGIGPKRRHTIKAAWGEQKIVRDIMVFLHSQGVSTSRAVRIYKVFGENAIEEVRANPYALSRRIPGIGFKTADQIAQNIGIPHDSVLRACAGLEHILLEATGEGHCCLPLELLKQQAGELLGISEAIIASGLERSILDGFLLRDSIAGEEYGFLPHIKRAEERIASVISRLCAGDTGYPAIDFEKAVAWCRAKTGKELAPTQLMALRQALTTRMLIITGGPGVGKTTLVNSILLILRAKKVRTVLCAPTGRAAKRLSETTGLEAKTIHRLLEVAPGGEGFQRNERNPLECDLLIVDETSMVDVPLMSALLRALPTGGNLLLVGDVDQLPSVGPGMVLRDLMECGLVPVVRLVEVFRQAANSRIITGAHHINQGRLPELADSDSGSDFHFVERDTPERITDTILQIVRERIPAKFHLNAMSDVQVLSPMNRGSLGVHELNALLQTALNPVRPNEPAVDKFGWQFRPRDKVMQTENDYDKEVFNGDIGQVTRIDPQERELFVKFDTREVKYDFGELDELTLAYAITIHKSQGSEFPAVVIPVATQHYVMLQRNLIYTGVTRGKKLVVLVGQKKALGIAVRNAQTQRRFSGLQWRLRNSTGSPGKR